MLQRMMSGANLLALPAPDLCSANIWIATTGRISRYHLECFEVWVEVDPFMGDTLARSCFFAIRAFGGDIHVDWEDFDQMVVRSIGPYINEYVTHILQRACAFESVESHSKRDVMLETYLRVRSSSAFVGARTVPLSRSPSATTEAFSGALFPCLRLSSSKATAKAERVDALSSIRKNWHAHSYTDAATVAQLEDVFARWRRGRSSISGRCRQLEATLQCHPITSAAEREL